MKKAVVINELFALRDGEVSTILTERPPSGRFIAVMACPVSAGLPPGDAEPVRPIDGAPVEMAAIIAAQVNAAGRWQWTHMSPATKEQIGDLLFDGGAELGRWYYLLIEDRLQAEAGARTTQPVTVGREAGEAVERVQGVSAAP